MELNSLYRMMRANAMDTDNKSHRFCVRWNEETRRELAKLALRSDATAAFCSKVLGISITSVRREAKRLGIQLRTKGKQPTPTYDVSAIVERTMLTHLAITMNMDYAKLQKFLFSIHNKKVKDGDKKLIPMLRDQWKALSSFAYPYRELPHYKINDIHDFVLEKYHRLYTLETLSHVLNFKMPSVNMRCRELGTACRSSHGLSDVQVQWLTILMEQHMAADTIKEITGLSFDTLEKIAFRNKIFRRGE